VLWHIKGTGLTPHSLRVDAPARLQCRRGEQLAQQPLGGQCSRIGLPPRRQRKTTQPVGAPWLI
jgi:hypothetical protein